MKLAKIQIENFRHLGTAGKPFELDFTDALGRVRGFTLLVGPNTSGKTTVLDAIAAALGPSIDLFSARPDFRLSPRAIVTKGANRAEVRCWLRFDDAEIEAAREIYVLSELRISSRKIPAISEVQLTWTYPDPESKSDVGVTQWDIEGVATLLRARRRLAQLLATGRAGWDWFHKVGGVFTFGQERSWEGRSVSRQLWNIIHGVAATTSHKRRLLTTDPESILLDLAVRALVPQVEGTSLEADPFEEIQKRYASVCAPRRIIGAIRDESERYTVQFSDGAREYGYEGLSSGERMLLLLLIRFAAEHIHNSIVLIDELELNQHPVWQRRLLHLLPKMGTNNQIIATTHSPYLRDAVFSDSVIDLGALDELARGDE